MNVFEVRRNSRLLQRSSEAFTAILIVLGKFSIDQSFLNNTPVNSILFGVADANSGINTNSLSIKADFTVNGLPPGSELIQLATQTSPGIYQITLDQAINPDSLQRHLFAQVYDNQGNVKRVKLRFITSDAIFIDGFE